MRFKVVNFCVQKAMSARMRIAFFVVFLLVASTSLIGEISDSVA